VAGVANRVISRRRWLRIGGCGFVIVVVAWLIAGFFVIVRPPTDQPSRVDAILVLGPPQVDGRITDALAMAAAGLADTVVISIPRSPGWELRRTCRRPGAGYTVICIRPEPSTTRGEAEELHRLTGSHHWTSVMVITSTYHVARARMLVKRCESARLLVVAASGRPSIATFAYQYLYQTGAFVKTFLHPNC